MKRRINRALAYVMSAILIIGLTAFGMPQLSFKVKAASELVSETKYLSGRALRYGDAYSVHVLRDNIKFTLPGLPSQSTVSKDVVVYTNDEENAWSLTETDDLKVEHQVKKSVTTNYEWTGDVASKEGTYTITSGASGSKVATIRKTVTTTYTDNDKVIADLTGSPAVENTDAYTIITDAPTGISIDEETGVISDADSGKSDSDTVFYYGDSRYSIGADTTLLTKADAEKKLSDFDDGYYMVTKYIVGEYSSEGKTLWTASSAYLYTKNAVLVEEIKITEDGNPQHKIENAQYVDSLNFPGVNPNYDVIISIKTDDINARVFVDPAMTVEHEEHNNTFTIPGDITKNDTYETYVAKVEDSLGKVQVINFAIYYGNGTPSISKDAIIGAKEVEGINYVSASSGTVKFSATAEECDAQIVDANVEISKNSDMSNPTSTKSANVSDGSISAEITKSDLNEGDNYLRVSAKSDYGLTTKSSTILKLVKDSKNPVLSNPVLSQEGSNVDDGTNITCMKDATITLDISDATPSSGIDKVIVNRENSEGGNSPVSNAPEISGNKVTLTIPTNEDNSGNSYIYKFKAYDKAGNESAEVTKKVSFVNDTSLSISRTVQPSVNNEFAVWGDAKVAIIDYTVTSDVDINEFATLTVDGEVKSNSADFVKENYQHYTYTLDYSTSKTIENIVFTIKNKNGYSVSDTITVLRLDVANPQDSGIIGDTNWQKSIDIVGTVSDSQDGDADAVSGLSTATYSVSNSVSDVTDEAIDIDATSQTGTISLTVPESATGEGTKITINLADNAGNKNSNTYTYFIDNTNPTADLNVTGEDDPVITYSGSDALSGLADTDGTVLTINGTVYNIVSGQKLSEIIGEVAYSTDYNFVLTVTDKAGNTDTKTATFNRVPPTEYRVTVSSDANGSVTSSISSGIEGAEVTITATANEGYKFAGWQVVSGGVTLNDANAATTTFNIGTENVEVKSVFEEIKEEPQPEPEPDPEPDPEIPEKDWLEDLRLALGIAAELGGPQTVEYSGDFALSYDIMLYLVEHPDITLIYTVTYEGVEYTITIPAGKAIADPNIPWYGPLWLLANYGGDNVPEVLAGSGKYTVVAGDTLSGIAAKFNTTVEELAKKNGIKNPDYIIVGQVIVY